tara:strand:- start:3396 stop:4487 length:1092 start_codon:yes stop_codon:yes gene_type:complete
MKKILIIGPFPDPISGVSLANQVVSEILSNEVNWNVSKLNTSFNKFDENVGSFSWDKLFFNLKFNLSVFKVINHDVIYLTPGQTFYGVTKYLLFFLFSWCFGKEIIFHVHGNHLAKEYSDLTGIKKWLFHFVLSKSKKGIVLSESLMDNISPFVAENGRFYLFNFAQDWSGYEAKNVEIEKKGLRIVFLSNLMKEKGINDLLNALIQLEKSGIKYEARIAGNIDAENESQVMDKLKELNNTSFIGVVKGQAKFELLEWANTFVLPTYYKMEGQPISILEAMAAKCVIVTTKHAGIPDIIQESKNGLFVEKQNSDSIYSVFRKLNKYPIKYNEIAMNNRVEYLEKYTVAVFGKQLLKILNSDTK